MSHHESLIVQELQRQHCVYDSAPPPPPSIRSNISDTWSYRDQRKILYFVTLCYYCFKLCCQSCCQWTSTLTLLADLRVLNNTFKTYWTSPLLCSDRHSKRDPVKKKRCIPVHTQHTVLQTRFLPTPHSGCATFSIKSCTKYHWNLQQLSWTTGAKCSKSVGLQCDVLK